MIDIDVNLAYQYIAFIISVKKIFYTKNLNLNPPLQDILGNVGS
jgi:hypothetical protein